MASRLFVLLALLALWVALPARAEIDLCDDDGDGIALPADEPVLTETVVPCAVVDSGALGPGCADAAFYVVTPHGTLLCRIELALLATGNSSPAVDAAPALAGGTQGPSAVVALVPLLPPAVQGGEVVVVPPPRERACLGPADAHLRARMRPS